MRHGPTSYCLALKTPIVHQTHQGNTFITRARTSREGDCFNMECNADGSYQIEILNQAFPCQYEHQEILLSDGLEEFVAGGVLCPNRDLVCSTTGCPKDCSGHGWCYKGNCYCHLGYSGDRATVVETTEILVFQAPIALQGSVAWSRATASAISTRARGMAGVFQGRKISIVSSPQRAIRSQSIFR